MELRSFKRAKKMSLRSLLCKWGRVFKQAILAAILGILVGLTLIGQGLRTLILAPLLLLSHPKIAQVSLKLEKSLWNLLLILKKSVSFHFPFRFLLILSLALIVILVPLSLAIVSIAKDLPSPTRLTTQDRDLTTEIYDRNGVLLYKLYADKNRALVSLEELPDYVKQATIAIEDKNFYRHKGIDPVGISRALNLNLKTGKLTGGSTITQQLIKNTLLTSEKTFQRKFKEAILAFWTEWLYPKDVILKMYLNEVAYGGPSWGIKAASETYFDKEPRDLTLGEAAILAGLPAAPTTYSPYGPDPELVKSRQSQVLRRMVEDRYISREQADAALRENVRFATQSAQILAPHFVMHVREEIIRKYGEARVYRGGLRVTTTLDVNIQRATEEIVRNEVNKLKNLQVGNGAALVTNPKTGEILAMVGSKNYFDKNSGSYNVTTALRQPGSSIKPVTYAAALRSGFAPATTILDSPVSFPMPGQAPYRPVNYDGRWHGPITLRQALGNSYNIPAVKLLAVIGLPEMIKMSNLMGITTFESENNYGLSLTLGGGEVKMVDMMSVYGVLATNGIRHNPISVLKMEDAHGNLIEEYQDTGKQVLEPEIAFLLTDILSDNNARAQAFGPNSPLKIDKHQVAVKTGTSDSKRDNWTFGYTPSYVVGVWVGNNNNSPMHPLLTSGITGAAPIWRQIMLKLLENQTPEKFSRPDGIIESTVRQGKPCLKEKEKCSGSKDLFVKNKPVKELVKVTKEQMVIPETGEVVSEELKFTDQFSTYSTPSAREENLNNLTMDFFTSKLSD